jgi:tetratricopeptide (TPR) repeat protein
MENLRYEKAAHMQEKAWLLNPDTTNTYLLFLSWLFYYEPIDKGDINCALQLGKLSRFLDKGISRDEIVGEFAQLTQKQLLYEGDETLYDSSYHLLMENVKDSTLSSELSFLYNYERGRILCNNMEYTEALPYTKKAFQLKQKNTDAKNNLLLTINNTLGSEEPIDRLELVNQLAGELPVLLDDNIFAQLRLSIYLMMVDQSFYNKNKTAGEQYLKEFEELYPQRNQKYHFLDGDIETAYGTAASYYFRLGQLSRSREILEKALLYVPNSFNLQNRLNAVK